MTIPKVFISYSHDSPEHKKWVLEIATKLRNNGIDAIIDQWELKAGAEIPSFMENHIKNSDYVLMICTDKYVEKANAGKGGVGYEKMIITSDLIKGIDSTKFIPIIRQSGTQNVPTFLETRLFINLSVGEDFEFNYDEIVRTIHGTPLYVKPEIGNNPFTSGEAIIPEKSNDALKKLMSLVVYDFDKGKNYSLYKDLVIRFQASRIMLDFSIKDADEKGLIRRDKEGDLVLTDKGKSYVVESGIVKL